ncbi:hypothetical protein [Rossellomorea vietnamensis]|uniref:hypothetical protein n=1 Tax=Rossellomorea vietnamensis TaxID=218284 RepID=UPI00054DF66B|nr:hypothetical protein [Rossellomorea vietnamensis]
MKIKVVMDSGKEYVTEKFPTMKAFLEKNISTPNTINLITLDEKGKILVNTSHISSIEVLGDVKVEYDDSDPLVYD